MTQPPAPAPSADNSGDLAYVPLAGPGVRAILAADPTFDVGRFLEGAKSAYSLILESFWKGDLATLKPHVDAHVFETFATAIEQRKKDGLTLDNRLVAIEQAVISEANLERSVAIVTVRFEADIVAVTRNAEGQVVAGSMSDAVQTRDLWTFRRDLASRDPNWLLIETDEEALASPAARSRSPQHCSSPPAPRGRHRRHSRRHRSRARHPRMRRCRRRRPPT